MDNIFRMSQCLEQVRLYFALWTEGDENVVCLLRKQLDGLTCKPSVMIFQLDNDTNEVTETMTL